MERKEKLLSYFNSKHYIPLKPDELAVVLDVPETDRDELAEILRELEREGKIAVTKKGRYVPCNEKSQRFSGVLKCNKSGKFGFVVQEEGPDIYISARDMGTALNGDTVLVKKTGEHNGKTEGSVIKVLERSGQDVIGVVYTKHKKVLKVKSDDESFYPVISIRPDSTLGAQVGQRVVVTSLNVTPDRHVTGRIKSILGSSDDISSYIESIIVQNGIKTEFDSETVKQSVGISDEINWDKDSRLDLRYKIIFTIDGELARDFDDAVGIECLDNGNYMLGVHIADVSEYVKYGTALDKEACERGTSVYLPDRVIPMLPEKLSNGVCSLNPDVERLTLSVFMEIDNSGNIVSNSIHESVIKSKERLTYTDMNRLFEEDDSALKEKYSHILEDLYAMRELASILREKRFRRGAIDFDFPESEIVTDDSGIPIEIRESERGVSNRLIEEFMLAANETVAEYMFWAELPAIYRVHEPPSMEKMAVFQEFLRPFGLMIKGKFDDENPVKPKAFEQIIDKVKGTVIEGVVSRTMLRSLMKAEYKAENLGHFGLAAKYYCHFTSPIRRYPDLVIHRSIKNMLRGENLPDMKFIQSAAKQSSEREVAADYCERDCDDLMKAAFMQRFIGCEFEGVVSGVTNFGMFVELGNSVEGMIRLENMTDDYFEFDQVSQSLKGERTGEVYTVGDYVSVMVVHSDLLSRNIDFILSDNVSRKLISKFTDKPAKRKGKKR